MRTRTREVHFDRIVLHQLVECARVKVALISRILQRIGVAKVLPRIKVGKTVLIKESVVQSCRRRTEIIEPYLLLAW